MRILHSHDPAPDDRALTLDEIKLTLARVHATMWEYAELGELPRAAICERSRDRLLDALLLRLGS